MCGGQGRNFEGLGKGLCGISRAWGGVRGISKERGGDEANFEGVGVGLGGISKEWGGVGRAWLEFVLDRVEGVLYNPKGDFRYKVC